MEHNSIYFIQRQDLQRALHNQEFYTVYQPQVELDSGRVVGMETLLRWRHPEWGTISPADFIPLAEESGMMNEITRWVLKRACNQNKKWQDKGLPNFKVSVNISPIDFENDELYEIIVNTLDETGLDPKYLELEITETAIMKNIGKTIGILNRLNETGVSISVDDFGIGNSSLAYIRDLPVSKVKIDRTFMQNIPYNKKKSSIVKDIIQLCHNLNLQIVAEGVETEEEVIFLSLHHCSIAQGFLFSKPIFVKKIEESIRTCEEYAVSLIYRLEDQINLGAAKMNEHRFESLFNQNPDMVCSVGLNGKILSVNPAIKNLLGYKAQEVVNTDMKTYIQSGDTEQVLNVFNKLLDGEEINPVNIRLVHKDNHLVYCNITCVPMRLGNRVVGIYSVIKDITKQTQLERALSESERKYRLLMENMSDLMSLVDTNGVIQYASPSHQTLLGVDSGQIEGSSIFDFILSEDIERAKQGFDQIIETKKPRYIEIRLNGYVTESLWLEAHGTPVFNNDQTISHIVIVSRDITDRKRKENNLLKIQRKLKDTISKQQAMNWISR